MWPDLVSIPGPLALELDALLIALCDLATYGCEVTPHYNCFTIGSS